MFLLIYDYSISNLFSFMLLLQMVSFIQNILQVVVFYFLGLFVVVVIVFYPTGFCSTNCILPSVLLHH